MITYGEPVRITRKGKIVDVWYSRTYDVATKRRAWESTRCRTLKEAKQWVTTQRMFQAMGPERVRAAETAEMTFEAAVEAWLQVKEETVSKDRYEINRYRVGGNWLPFFRKKKLTEITSEDVQQYLRKRKAKGLSSTTVNDDRSGLSNFFNFCIRKLWLLRSPTIAVERYKGEIRRRVRTLSVEEENKFLTACREPSEVVIRAKRNKGGRTGRKVSAEKAQFTQTFTPPDYLYPIVLVALRSGLRRKTILNLRWRHIDFERGVWDIPGEIVKTAEPYQQPIARSLLSALEDSRRRLLEEYGTERVGKNALIFGLPPGASFKRSFQRAARRAGLERLTFHDLRRVFLNRLRERGVPIDVAMSLTGHRDISVVAKFYREVPLTVTREALRALDDLPMPAPESGKKTGTVKT